MVPEAEFGSYYGRPILKEPVWKVPDVPGYLVLGGLAGASASMAALAELTGRRELIGVGRIAATAGALGSVCALVHDLGRPDRFLNMLRVFKPTSPLSVGSWMLAPFSGLAAASAASWVTGRLPRLGSLAGFGAGTLGPALCTYTAVLLADTAIPAWHEAYPELPYVFGGSALATAAGVTMAAVPPSAAGPARRMGVIGAGMELAASARMERRLGLVGEPYREGGSGRLLRTAKALTVTGAAMSLLGRRHRLAGVASGAAFLGAAVCTRFGVYYAGMASARDPKYVVIPQRERTRSTAGDRA